MLRRNVSTWPSSPGVVQSSSAHSSVSRFSTGVPVMAILAADGRLRIALAVEELGFLICWASSATTSPQLPAASSSVSRRTMP